MRTRDEVLRVPARLREKSRLLLLSQEASIGAKRVATRTWGTFAEGRGRLRNNAEGCGRMRRQNRCIQNRRGRFYRAKLCIAPLYWHVRSGSTPSQRGRLLVMPALASVRTPADTPAETPRRLTRRGSRSVSTRLAAPDRERLARALDGRGVSMSGHIRRLILRDLEASGDYGTPPAMT